MAHSLRLQLLGWMLVPLGLLAALNATAGWYGARQAADLVTDRTLLASARSIAEQAHLEDGTVQLTVPPAAIEMFDNGAGDFVYYAATGLRGELLAGVSGLPAGARHPARADGAAFQARFRGRLLRLIAVDHPLTGPGVLTSVRVTVGVSLRSRDALLRRLWLAELGQQTALVLGAGLFMGFGLKRGLAPLVRVRDTVLARPAESLDPLDQTAVQAELQPLVLAINRQMARVQAQLAAQHRFVNNAAHQLRTPLTLVHLQATYALRRPGLEEARETLEAICSSTQQLSRLAGQLLTLARAEPGGRRSRHGEVDLGRLAARVLESFARPALDKGIDLGLDARQAAIVRGDETLLGEVLVNLVDNATRYCPPGSVVTVSVDRRGDEAVIAVRDDGPGVPPDEVAPLFERFYRVSGTAPEGSGLGLAIVREVAAAGGGDATAANAAGGGLVVEVRLPWSDGETSGRRRRPKAD